jgi:hypothetical protein
MAMTVPFPFPSQMGNAPAGLPEALALFAQRRAQQMPGQQPPEVQGRLAAGLPSGGFWNSPGVPLPSLAKPAMPNAQPGEMMGMAQPQQAMAYGAEPPKPAMPAAVGAMPPAAPSGAPASPAGAPAQGGNWWQDFAKSGGGDFLGNALTDLGAGLASGKDWQEGLGIATQRMAELGPQRQQGRQAQQQQNATLAWLNKSHPELAGLPPEVGIQIAMAKLKGNDPTALMQNLAAAGLQPGTPEYQDAILRGIQQGTTVNVGDNSSKFTNKADELAAGRLSDMVTSGQGAQTLMGDLMALTEIGKNIDTGKGAEIIAALGPYAEALGVKIDGLGEMQAYDSIVQRMAPQMRPPGSGASSDFDARQFLKGLPGLGKTPEGNQIITQTFSAIQQAKVAASDIAMRALSGEITWQQADKEIAEIGNPYEAFNEYRKRQPATAAPSAVTPKRLRFNPATGDFE